MSIKNDGHYFCRAGGNRPDGLNEPVTLVCTDFGIKMDIHVIFIKDRMLCCIFRHDRSLIRMEHRSVISIPFDHSRR
ncbi:hypothetical protein FS611_01655 [Escherichia coli]|nr:hypothetical protein FS611_01655 [Escherichia coli]